MNWRTILLGYFFIIPFGLLAFWWAVVCLSRREFLTAVVAVGFGVGFMSMCVPPTLSITSRIVPRASCDGQGTMFRPDLLFDVATSLTIVAFIFSCAMFAVFNPLGMLDIPVPNAVRNSTPFLAGAVALMGIPVIWLTIRRRGIKYLRLTPAGYEVAESYVPERGSWDEVVEVTDVAPKDSRQVPNPLVLVKSDGTAAVLAAGPMTPGGRDLRELVRFYWQHADLRDELTDGRAMERLRSKRFDADL